MGISTQAKLVVKHTFLEFAYEHPEPKVQGSRMRAMTDIDILEPRRQDWAATHCKSIGSKVPEAAASLVALCAASAAAEEAAALAAAFADETLCKSDADLNILEDSTEVSTEASASSAAYVEAVEAYGVAATNAEATNELKSFLGIAQGWEEQQAQMMPYGGFNMTPMAMDAHGQYYMTTGQEMSDMTTPSAPSCFRVTSEDLQYQSMFMSGDMGAGEQVYQCHPGVVEHFPGPAEQHSMPNSYGCDMSMELMDHMGFCGQYDYDLVYMPMDYGADAHEQTLSDRWVCHGDGDQVYPCQSGQVDHVGAVDNYSASEHSEPLDETRTTVMLRNLPNNYTCDMLLELVDSLGFCGRYDLVYLPVDFSTGAGLGYAFVNLLTAHDVPAFWDCFAGFCDWIVPSDKVCSVTWSHPHQGLTAHVERYRNSPVLHAAVPSGWKPALFENGVRVPFPAPTKKLKAPRIKCLESM